MKNNTAILVSIFAFVLFSSVSTLSQKLKEESIMYDLGEDMKTEHLQMRNKISKQRRILAEQSVKLTEVLQHNQTE